MIKIIASFVATFGICWGLYVLWKGLDKKGRERLFSDIRRAIFIGITAVWILLAIVYLF